MDAKVPKFIQLAIKRMYWHNEIVQRNSKKVKEWMVKNNIDSKTDLKSLVNEDSFIKYNVCKGQMCIDDY